MEPKMWFEGDQFATHDQEIAAKANDEAWQASA